MHEATRLYHLILETAQIFLHNSKHFTVEVLAQENPSYEAVASFMARLVKVIHALSDDFDPMLSQKAHDYCEIMERMGAAISKMDQDLLTKLTEHLDKRPFL